MKLTKKLQDNFTIIDNRVLKLKELSLQAKGLYTIMISLSEDWNFSVKGLSKLSANKETATNSAIKELEDFGLLKREKYQDEKGYFDMNYTIFDFSTRENTDKENPSRENPDKENQRIYKENINKEKSNKEITDMGAEAPESVNAEIIDEEKILNKNIGEVIKQLADKIDPKNKLYFANKTQREATKFLILTYSYENVLKMIDFIAKYGAKLEYMPNITTPCELRDKWVKVMSLVNREKIKNDKVAESFI